MSSQDDDGQQGLVLWLVFGLVALVIALVVGVGVYQRGKMAAKPKTAVAVAAQNAADVASVKIDNGVVKFCFASGNADFAMGANEVLADVIKGAQAGKKLVISGYQDATGGAAINAEVARNAHLRYATHSKRLAWLTTKSI